MSKDLADYPVTLEMKIAWGDMDAFQHVNNVVYFRYFESARIRYFEEVTGGGAIGDDGIGPILASTSCRYRAPLTYPDTLTVGARVTKVEEDRFTMEYAVFSHQGQVTAATGEGVVVAFNYTLGQKASLPDRWRDCIARIEGQAERPARGSHAP